MPDLDQIALDTVKAIANIDPDKLEGGRMQAMAQAQCLVRDALRELEAELKDAKACAENRDGSGLPPVGCECECKRYPSGREWVDCKVVGHDLEDGFYVAVARIGSEYLGLPMANFRPIRTDEDKAVEEMLTIVGDFDHNEGVCRALYRAGYREMENAS